MFSGLTLSHAVSPVLHLQRHAESLWSSLFSFPEREEIAMVPSSKSIGADYMRKCTLSTRLDTLTFARLSVSVSGDIITVQLTGLVD